MKKSWCKLWDIAKKRADNNYQHAWSIYTHMFLMHYQHADEIVLAYEGTPLEARYKCGDLE